MKGPIALGALFGAANPLLAAEPAQCVVNLVGKGSYSGPCYLHRKTGGSFLVEAAGTGTLPTAVKRVEIVVASPRRAMMTGIGRDGTRTRWGAVRQAPTGCWLGMQQSVCVNDDRGASILVFTGIPAAPAAASPATTVGKGNSWTVRGRLSRIDAGDNLWLAWIDGQGRPQISLCSAPVCDEWMRAGALPRALVGREAVLTLKKGKAMSGDTVMDDADKLVAIDILNPAKARK